MEEKNTESRQENRKSLGKRLAPLINLGPAFLVLVLIVGSLPVTNPVLEEIPELLTINAEAAETEAAEDEDENEEEEQAQGNFEDGVYVGTGTGYGGTITVQVTVEDGNIVSVEILSAPGETSSFLSRAKGVIDLVIQSQTWEVDVISGATYSSRGILAAIQNALTGEEVETEEAETQEQEELEEEEFDDPDGYTDGTYYGSAQGFGGTIQVKVVISGGQITDISIVSASGETASYLASAKAVISRILSAQSPNVDTVSGATYSSTGIINAVKSALSQAATSGNQEDLQQTTVTSASAASSSGSSSSNKTTTVVVVQTSEDGYVDGTYTGTAEGFGGDITVQVVISGGQIVSITILSAEDETASYLERASAVLDEIIEAQSTAVDTVSGATYSSTGILNAVAAALENAVSSGSSSDSGTTDNSGTDSGTSSGTNDNSEEEENTGESGNSGNSGDSGDSGDSGESGGSGESGDSGESGSSDSDPKEESTAKYADGVYEGTAICTDEDVFDYEIVTSITVNDGVITAVSVEKINDNSEYPDDNETYLNYAINGRTRKGVWYEGIVNQILEKQSADSIDIVSSATYSSQAITKAAQAALEQAAISTENEEDSGDTGDAEEYFSAQAYYYTDPKERSFDA